MMADGATILADETTGVPPFGATCDGAHAFEFTIVPREGVAPVNVAEAFRRPKATGHIAPTTRRHAVAQAAHIAGGQWPYRSFGIHAAWPPTKLPPRGRTTAVLAVLVC